MLPISRSLLGVAIFGATIIAVRATTEIVEAFMKGFNGEWIEPRWTQADSGEAYRYAQARRP